MIERLRLNVATHIRMQQQRAEFRAENQVAVDLRVQKRLFTDAIEREKQFLRTCVPDREVKHATQVLRAVSAELIVSVNDGFGVAVGVERVAQLFEFLTQLRSEE